jgi:RNA polymerase sigma-70 factor (ECF subfamily)
VQASASDPENPCIEPDPRVARAKSGDAEAIHSLLVELIPRVRNLIRYLVRSDAETDDFTQDALIVVLRDLATYRGEGTLYRWADRVVARVTIRRLRSERARAVVELRPQPQDVEPTCSSDELLLRRAVVRLLDRLPFEQRHALVLHHVLEMTVSEIAKELDTPVETIRSRLRLARNKLRQFGFAVDRKDETAE